MLQHVYDFSVVFKAECVYITFCLSFHLSMDTFMGCFYLLANVNNAALNTDVQITVSLSAFKPFEGICPEVELMDNMLIYF